MESRFYTQAELTQIRVKTTGAQNNTALRFMGLILPSIVQSMPQHLGCWPATTVAKLSDARDLIKAAWELKDHIAGVMLIKNGLTLSPLYLHSDRLAYKLSKAGDYWIPFNEIAKELEQ